MAMWSKKVVAGVARQACHILIEFSEAAVVGTVARHADGVGGLFACRADEADRLAWHSQIIDVNVYYT
jgi:hypothetical protein